MSGTIIGPATAEGKRSPAIGTPEAKLFFDPEKARHRRDMAASRRRAKRLALTGPGSGHKFAFNVPRVRATAFPR